MRFHLLKGPTTFSIALSAGVQVFKHISTPAAWIDVWKRSGFAFGEGEANTSWRREGENLSGWMFPGEMEAVIYNHGQSRVQSGELCGVIHV